MLFTVVDLETTGGPAGLHRITEVGMVKFDGEKVLDTYNTLINPERDIPPFVAQLTGISEEMVEQAPLFSEKAEEILDFIGDSVFVAHNVGFDYGFLKQEFRDAGFTFNLKRLCTVRLARKVIPGLPSYSLGKLCRSLGVQVENRHRAMGDAMATTKILQLIIESDEKGQIEKSLKRNSKEAVLPPHLDKKTFESLPEKPGIYFFNDKTGKVIYVGKAKNIRKRVYSHFQGRHEKAQRMRQEIHDVKFELTGSELLAFLRETEEIKSVWPEFNTSQKRYGSYWGVFVYEDQQGFNRLAVDKVRKGSKPVRVFGGMWRARNFVWLMVKEYNLCAQHCGLMKDCFMAPGVIGEKVGEKKCSCKLGAKRYNKKVEKAINGVEKELEDVLIIARGRDSSEKAIIQVASGDYRGFAFVPRKTLKNGFNRLSKEVAQRKFYPEMRWIIESHLNGDKTLKTIRPKPKKAK